MFVLALFLASPYHGCASLLFLGCAISGASFLNSLNAFFDSYTAIASCDGIDFALSFVVLFSMTIFTAALTTALLVYHINSSLSRLFHSFFQFVHLYYIFCLIYVYF